MSKNTANRTFYYKDSTEGVFAITINARGRDTGIELSANQKIIVSPDSSQNSGLNSYGEVLGVSDGLSSYSPSSQSSAGNDTRVSSLSSRLEILVGNDRVTSPGSPIWFQATVKKNTTLSSTELNWSFGDGNVGVGPLVSHSYKYPGDYVVVLSAKAGDIFSVSRLKVKVAESSILVSDGGEYLEITNNGNTEINLFNWRIENNGKGFVFQPNTIILPHFSVRFDKSLLKMKGYDNSLGISLKNSLGEAVFAVALVKKVDLSEASKNLEIIKREVFAVQGRIPNMKAKIEETKIDLENLPQTLTSTENIVYEAPKQEGLISRLTNFIKRVFSN